MWTRDYVLAVVTNLFIAVVFYEMMTATALYAVERYRASDSGAGLAAGAFMIGAVASRVVGGKYLDIIGRRRTLVVSLAACVALPLLYGVVDPLWMFVLIRALHGAAFGLGSIALSTGALAMVPVHRRGEAAGYYGLAPVVASAAGAILGGVLIHAFGYPALFVSNAACAAAGLAFALLLRLPERQLTDEDRRAARRWTPSALVDGPAAALSSIVFIAGVGFSSLLAFLNAYSASDGAGEAAGVYFLVYAATALVGRMVVGRAQDRFGERRVIPPLLVALAAGLAVVAIAPAGVSLVASGVLVGFGFGALFPVVHAAVFSAASPRRVGLATSTFYLVGDGGIAIGPPLVGLFIPVIGFHGVFVALAILIAVTAAVYLLISGRRTTRT
nr:MFS transporter [Microbacterium ureisolvens]